MYKLETDRKIHLCETADEVDKKAWLAKLLNEWVRVYRISDDGWECFFNWPARKLPKEDK